MKELRQELDNIGVDYTACIEKSEMFDLLQNKVPPRSLHLPPHGAAWAGSAHRWLVLRTLR